MNSKHSPKAQRLFLHLWSMLVVHATAEEIPTMMSLAVVETMASILRRTARDSGFVKAEVQELRRVASATAEDIYEDSGAGKFVRGRRAAARESQAMRKNDGDFTTKEREAAATLADMLITKIKSQK